MALTPEERKKISAQLLSTPAILSSADQAVIANNAQIAAIEETDNLVNKPVFDVKNALANSYMRELRFFDGIQRQEITETDIQNGAKLTAGNFFFPNQPTINLPSLPDNVWTNAVPFGLSAAIGKGYNESYPATGLRTELDIIADLEAQFVIVEGLTEIVRITGQSCEVTTPVPPPVAPDESDVSADPTMQQAKDDILALVGEWKTMMGDEKGEIPKLVSSDSDSVRQTANDIAVQNIDDTITNIRPWELLPNFDPEPSGSVGVTCDPFNNIDTNTKANTKFRSSQLPLLKNEVQARKTYINTTRIVDLPNFLGNIDQNILDGTINNKTGVYGERFATINIRLNLVLGDNLASLNNLKGQNNGIEAGKEGAQDKFDVYSLLLAPTAIEAPTSNTLYVQVKDGSIFGNGDGVFIISDSQPETPYTIDIVEGNRIKMTTKVPQKYRPEEGARIYKEL